MSNKVEIEQDDALVFLMLIDLKRRQGEENLLRKAAFGKLRLRVEAAFENSKD